MLYFVFLLLLELSSAIEYNYYPPGGVYSRPVVPPTELPFDDDYIIRTSILLLHNIFAATDLSECGSCKLRLSFGKALALTRPDIVPQIFVEWCKEEGFASLKCQTNFGYPTLDSSTLGNEFTIMLQMMNPEGLDGDLFCYFHDSKCHVMPELPEIDLNKLWPPKPQHYIGPKPSGESFNVLHISDFALQTDYQLLAESNCSQAICCSANSYNKHTPPLDYDYSSIFDPLFGLSFYDSSYEKGHFQKGPFLDQYKSFTPVWAPSHEFGSYNCDSPELLINSTLQVIRDYHENHLDFEFALFTGGMTSHAESESVTKEYILDAQFAGYRDIHKYLEGIPVIPAFGVRDNFPLNQFPVSKSIGKYNYQWQFDFLADLWEKFDWVDTSATKEIRYNKVGFSVVTKRGLKIISLNSNVWNKENLYLFVNTLNFDPFGIWQYLIDELIDSETNDQRVWIIAHLPPSKHALPVPSRIFVKIIERFSPKVIAALFFGYNLKDQFEVIYGGDGTDKSLENVVNFALLGPSVTPLRGNNPGWRSYSVDSDSFDIINSFTYYTKLNQTFVNGGAEPVWEYEYLARDAFDVGQPWPVDSPLDASFWHMAAQNLRDSAVINKRYESLQFRNSPFEQYYYLNDDFSQEPTDSDILENDNYCKATSFTVENRKYCMLTDDQDDYSAPREQVTYIPVIRPYHPPEYVLMDDHSDQNSNENYEVNTRDKSDFEENPLNNHIGLRKTSSLRDKLTGNHQLISAELAKRDQDN